MQYDLDEGAGEAARLGLIVLSTDEVLEYEARRILQGQAVNMMHARIFSHAEVTQDTLRTMQKRMGETANLLPAGLDAVAYGCTSASVMIGPDVVEHEIQSALPGVAVANPIFSVLAALAALNAKRIALVTPYLASVARPMRDFLMTGGIETVSEICFGESEDRKVARITEASTLAAILKAGKAPGVEAVFASCTNLRCFGIIDQAEAALGLPVISSNLALMWHLLKQAKLDATGWGPGRLFQV